MNLCVGMCESECIGSASCVCVREYRCVCVRMCVSECVGVCEFVNVLCLQVYVCKRVCV